MLFNSLTFAAFFPLVVLLYFALPYRARTLMLLAASYYFYMCWKPEYILLILFTTAVSYVTALWMGRAATPRRRRGFLILSLAVNLGILFSFKYFNFFNDAVADVFNHFNIFYGLSAFNALLPVGISFYTFQTLSYSIDVYRKEREPETNPVTFATYVAFFPQLVAGPIERSTSLLPQFRERHDFDYRRVTDGLKLMAWGFFKKLVIADRLAKYVNEVYNNPGEYQGAPIIIATYFFAFQIYCDFSGYSDIAIGSARVMGFRLMDNFKRPYFAQSISEFWSRWHISLSTWFRDYLYIPLGGNRVSRQRWYGNILIVFIISGLWHGANWTFIVWGALHGLYFVTSSATQPLRKRISRALGMDTRPQLLRIWKTLVTFHLVLVAWIFFRANSLTEAFVLIKGMFSGFSDGVQLTVPNFSMAEMILAVLAIGFMEAVHLVQQRQAILPLVNRQPVWVRWAIYNALIASILLFGRLGSQSFVYFQF